MAMQRPSSPLEITSNSPGRLRRRNRPSRLTLGCDLPVGTAPFEFQVAGHTFGEKKDSIGVLKWKDGCILKPLEKTLLGEREITFYERLQVSVDPLMLELRQYIPQYHGTTEFQLKDRCVKFLILKNIIEGMSQPCVMDIKIGKRTWDPLAGPAKKAGEEKKYAECKREYGFCIPGFQVFRLSTGHIKRYGKEYGKTLGKKTTVEALGIFLNAKPDQPPFRDLVVQLLSTLWKILTFFRSQTKLRFYSSSVLLAYDAKRLRQNIRAKSKSTDCRGTSVNKTLSPSSSTPSFENTLASSANTRIPSMSLNVRPLCSPCNGFSGQLTQDGPIFEKAVNNHSPISTPSMSPVFTRTSRFNGVKRSQSLKRNESLRRSELFPKPPGSPILQRDSSLVRNASCGKALNVAFEKLCRTHSYENNFDKDIIKMKEEYAALLYELSTTPEERQNWVRVNMIDFAHVFPAENGGLDTNYLEGIENLIKLLENFLVSE